MVSLVNISQAICDRLNNDATLDAKVIGLYERTKDSAAYPYIVIDDLVVRDWSTASTNGVQADVRIMVHSRHGGRAQALDIMDRVYALLHDASFSITGASLIQCRMRTSNVQPMRDGMSHQGQMDFRMLVQA